MSCSGHGWSTRGRVSGVDRREPRFGSFLIGLPCASTQAATLTRTELSNRFDC